jgi:hypothetical protein
MMAFQAKDGSKHTNVDSMKTANAKHMAHQPKAEPQVEPSEQSGEPAEEMGEQHDIGNIDELTNAMDQHLQEEASGQPHDPANIDRLHKHFSKYLTEEKHEG